MTREGSKIGGRTGAVLGCHRPAMVGFCVAHNWRQNWRGPKGSKVCCGRVWNKTGGKTGAVPRGRDCWCKTGSSAAGITGLRIVWCSVVVPDEQEERSKRTWEQEEEGTHLLKSKNPKPLGWETKPLKKECIQRGRTEDGTLGPCSFRTLAPSKHTGPMLADKHGLMILIMGGEGVFVVTS